MYRIIKVVDLESGYVLMK